ncbi:hypothetical protein SERLA73DRAFT_165237 [Serpula lacrymans var. lacrymans S7.3]|uniref:Cyclin N-terminal domain-containing protein n=2 Tax=Serpula lacrymans var. lacrymans TaxID=341189 RepID=F8PKM6_SERL3|nr:hypothetical protein SERLA73DRAFT_165237 [Serpula lacrymans var. lacrymans S7.3]
MASNIPTRRVTRTTRMTTLKDNENANARPSRLTARVKPPSSNGSGTATTGGLTRATAATAASRAKANGNDENKVDLAAQGKRKREALGEVTKFVNKNKTTNVPAKEVKGKGKEAAPVKEVKEKFDGVVIQSKPSLVAAARQPLRTVSGSTTRRATRSTVVAPQGQNLDKVKEESGKVADEDAMAIDDHPTTNAAPSAEPQPRRVSTRRSGLASQAAVDETRPSEIPTRLPTRPPAKHEDDVEDNRVFKKRRTSSDIPDEAKLFEQEQLQQEAEEVAAALEAYADSEPEADPYGDQWDDLDAEDADDPLMVSEYVIEIFNYMKEIELTTMPNPNYMESQKELAWKMRGILTDWLVQVHVRFRLLPETLFLCVNLIDRFLSARVVSLAKLQLVGITCLFVAAKVEEIVAPSVAHFLYCADSSYTETEILQAERYVLKTLDWNLSYPNPMHFLRRISKADEYDVKARTIAKYFLEIQCLEWRLLAAPPSLIAAAAIWLARLILGQDKWTPNLAHYSSYAESTIIPTANLMLNYVLKPIKHESFHKKYAGKRFLKSSIWVRDWALERWSEGTQVALLEELPMLKAQNRAERARAEAAAAVTAVEAGEEYLEES